MKFSKYFLYIFSFFSIEQIILLFIYKKNKKIITKEFSQCLKKKKKEKENLYIDKYGKH